MNCLPAMFKFGTSQRISSLLEGDEFNHDMTSAKDVPAHERHVAADGHQRALGSALPAAFLQDVARGGVPREWDAAVVPEASGGDAVGLRQD